MHNSIFFTITSVLSLLLIVAALALQVLEMHTYGMLPF